MFFVANGRVRELDRTEHLSPKTIQEKYGQARPLLWAGAGAQLHAATLREWAEAREIPFSDSSTDHTGWTLAAPEAQLAISIAALALNEYRNGKAVRPAELQAVYVRASDAEINEKWRLEK
jgi:tRNA A37 threonylcarbamoyladenosine modification protein TsaB